jgi:ribosomal protein L7/L12
MSELPTLNEFAVETLTNALMDAFRKVAELEAKIEAQDDSVPSWIHDELKADYAEFKTRDGISTRRIINALEDKDKDTFIEAVADLTDFNPATVHANLAMMMEVDRANVSELLSAIRNGRKIDAIKIVRRMFGLPLKEAKDFVEEHYFDHAPSLGDILKGTIDGQ